MLVRDMIMKLMEMPINAEVLISRVGDLPIDDIRYNESSNTVFVKSDVRINTETKQFVSDKKIRCFCIGYVDGYDLKFKYFHTSARDNEEAIENFWDVCGRNFEHRITGISLE